MVKRQKIQKNTLASGDKRKVGRLTDMDTREVSIVDRPANKKPFLIIKNEDGQGEGGMGDTATMKEQSGEADLTEGLSKTVIETRLEEALSLLDIFKAKIEAAEVGKGDALPESVSRAGRVIQFLVKSIAEPATGGGLVLFSGSVEKQDFPPISETGKTMAVKVIDEVHRRVSSVKNEVAGAELLDGSQSQRLSAAADMLGSTPTSKGTIVAASLTEEVRNSALDHIEKAMVGLSDLYISLKTNTVAKSDHIADQFEVSSTLEDFALELDAAIGEMLKTDGKEDPTAEIVKGVRGIRKSLGKDAEGVLDAISKEVSVVSKAAAMFRACYGAGDTGVVKLSFPEEKVAEFDSYEEARAYAFKLNVKAALDLLPMMKNAAGPDGVIEVVKTDDGYAVRKGEEVVWKGEDLTEAAATCSRLNMEAISGRSDTAKTEEEESVVTDENASEKQSDEPVEKVGRPMKQDRVKRMKGAVSLLKEAINDAVSGAISLEKFREGIDALNVLLSEIQTAKRMAEHNDPEGEREPGDQNVGSGNQHDMTSVTTAAKGVPGEGVPQEVTDLIKEQFESLKKELLGERDESNLVSALKREIKMIKSAKSAPSSTMDDEVVTKTKKSDAAIWPLDMNNEKN